VSDSDSFIDEVSEEVRRDRLFALMRRYGWIAVLAVLLLVGGAGYIEWQKAQDRARAEALGDAMLAAQQAADASARVAALDKITPDGPGSAVVIDMMAAADAMADDPQGAVTRLLRIADTETGAAPIYREIATLKAVMIPNGGLDMAARRSRLEGLMLGGGVIRLLAEEQMAYLDIETGDTAAAIKHLRAIASDAEATPGLRQRATQVIVALGGDLNPVAEDENTDAAATDGTGVGD
jgi:hypothetical protein